MPVRSMSNYGVPCTDIKAVVCSHQQGSCAASVGTTTTTLLKHQRQKNASNSGRHRFWSMANDHFETMLKCGHFVSPPLWTCGASLVLCQTPDGLTLQKCREFPFQLHWRPQNQIRILLYHLPEEVVEQSWNQMRLNK
jgi:hypothetical protein